MSRSRAKIMLIGGLALAAGTAAAFWLQKESTVGVGEVAVEVACLSPNDAAQVHVLVTSGACRVGSGLELRGRSLDGKYGHLTAVVLDEGQRLQQAFHGVLAGTTATTLEGRASLSRPVTVVFVFSSTAISDAMLIQATKTGPLTFTDAGAELRIQVSLAAP